MSWTLFFSIFSSLIESVVNTLLGFVTSWFGGV